MSKAPEIKIKISAEAEQVNKAFSDIKSSADKLKRQVGPAFSAMRSDLGRVGGSVKSVISPVADLDKIVAAISFAGAVAGAMALKGYIEQIKGITLETSNDISRMYQTAASFGIDQKASGDAVRRVRALEAIYESFGFEREDALAVNTALNSISIEAASGAEGAIEKFKALGIYKEDLFQLSGELKSADELIASIASRTRDMDRGSLLSGITGLIGEGDSSKLLRIFSVLEEGTGSVADQLELFASRIDSRDDDIEKSEKLQGTLIDEKLSWENLGKAIFRGFVDPMVEASKSRAAFYEGVKPEAEKASALAGGLYESVSGAYYEQAQRLINLMTDVSEDGVAPLESAFVSLDGIITDVFKGAVDVIELFATGETDAAWLQGVQESSKSFREDLSTLFGLMVDAAKNIDTLITKISGLYESLGIDQPWAQVGITAGLIFFSSTIISVLALVGKLVAAISTATGATAALGAAAGGAGAAAGGAAAAVGAAVKQSAKAGVGFTGGFMLLNEADFMSQVGEILDRGVELAKTEGEAFGAGYLKAALGELRDQKGGDGLIMGLLDSVVDKSLGTNLIPDFDDLDAQINLTVNESNAADAIAGARAAFHELGDALGWEVDDDGQVEIGGGLAINGASLKEGALEAVLLQLEGLKATVDLQPLDIEGALGDYRMTMPALSVRPGADTYQPVVNPTSLQPVTINIEGQRRDIQVAPDSVEPLRQALQLSARARS